MSAQAPSLLDGVLSCFESPFDLLFVLVPEGAILSHPSYSSGRNMSSTIPGTALDSLMTLS
jgi:hypothetical protein